EFLYEHAIITEAGFGLGDDRVFIEKFIVDPRHIEIQVLADKHGNTIHLGERECSIQRRNQKVIEEAPSPFLDAKTRKAMGDQAVALAKAVDYESAGTVEFIVDKDRNFYFLEMNTRLQVEHPVTELITGIDLVEQMIRVAAGEKLSLKQSNIKLNGWAIESRIYAEDPYRNFLPSIGRLTRYRPPQESVADGLTIRNDTGVFDGGEISMYYDPMIAKLCTHGPDRKSAIDHMSAALDDFYVDGIRHNIPFLSALMRHPRWIAGELTTNFIAEEYPDGFFPRLPSPEETSSLAVVAAVLDQQHNTRRRTITGQMTGDEVSFASRRVVRFEGEIDDVALEVARVASGVFSLRLGHGEDATPLTVESDWNPGDSVWRGTIDGTQLVVQVRPVLNGYQLDHQGVSTRAQVFTRREAELAALMPEKLAADTSNILLCPMPGLVTRIDVSEGDTVEAGDPLCVVEAMKMENILRAERDATIAGIKAAAGDSLAVDAVIMEFAPKG
ncbi:MAG: biotin/lipoyl-containing protein, partial [Pseudomonadota bacterium]